jgi:hypothetical protein
MKEPKRLTLTNFNFPDRTVKEKSEWVSKEDYDRVVKELEHAKEQADVALFCYRLAKKNLTKKKR